MPSYDEMSQDAKTARLNQSVTLEKTKTAAIDDDQEQNIQIEDVEKANTDTLFKPNAVEKHIFSLVYGMVKENELSFSVVAGLLVLEDLQLFSYSWRHTLVDTDVLRYIFNPFLALVENYTLASHIVSLVLLVILLISMVYCGFSLSSGQMRWLLPLHVLRFLTIVISTILYIPIFETFMLPTNCSATNVPNGYADMLCNQGGHIGILVSAIVGAVFVTAFAFLMSLLYFDSNVSSKGGKRHGRVDLFYVAVRVVLVIIERKLDDLPATAINTVLLLALTGYFVREQPFYKSSLNNLRTGLFTGAFALSVCSLVYSAIKAKTPIGLIAGGLGSAALCGGAAYVGNMFFVQWMCRRIYDGLKKYDLVVSKTLGAEKPVAAGIDGVRKSYAELLYNNTADITKRQAIVEQVRVFPSANWVDIAARFIQRSYMDKDAVTLANRLFEVGTIQYPASGTVYLTYLGYIKSFLSFLKGKERTHMNLMLRKCRLAFDERFLVYLQQQSIRQLDQMGRVANNDSDMQYTSYIEYQSLENSVKKYHVDTLLELRDFWQAVRSESSSQALALRLGKIASLANRTSELYQKLVNRFPNSRNMLLLYSRFLFKVTSDNEQATLYREMAEDVEDTHGKDDDDLGKNNVANDDDLERKSAAHSRASSSDSRESKLVRQKRNLLTSRLALPMQEFMRKVNVSSIAFIIVLIVAVVISKNAVDMTEKSLDNLEYAMVPRRAIHKIYADVRRITLAAEANNAADFKKYFDSLTTFQANWVKNVLPFYNTHALDTAVANVFTWDGTLKAYTAVPMNAYTASEHLMTALNNILDFGTKDYPTIMNRYKLRNATTNNPYFRYIYDNLDTMYDLIDGICNDVSEEYVGQVDSQNVLIGLLFGGLFGLLVIAGLIVPHRSLGSCFKTQNQVLGLFKKVPRSLVLTFITEIEEEIEIISGDSEKLQANFKANVTSDAEKGGLIASLTLKWQYLVLCLGMLGAIPGMLVVVFQHNLVTQYVPKTFNNSNKRRTDMSQRIYTIGQEVVADDVTTWRPYFAVATMSASCNKMEELHLSVSAMLSPFLQDSSSPLFTTLRNGRCFFDPPSLCEKSSEVPEIGYTQAIYMGGVDTQIIRFIDEGRRYIDEQKFAEGLSNVRLRLMEYMATDFTASSLIIKGNILDIVRGSISFTSLILFLLMGIVLGLSILAYYIGFFTTARSFEWDNQQLIALLYFIPSAERTKIADIHTFIESGGAMIN